MFRGLGLTTFYLIISLCSGQSAYAYTLIKADEFDCVREVIPASGLPSGIVTSALEKGVFVKTCDGEYAALSFRNDKITLNETNAKIPSRLLKGQKDGLLDSEVSSSKTIKAAWLTGSTQRYRHNILGDDVEASGMAVIDRNGKRYDLELDKNSVFEDRKIRIADLDEDGKEELIVVRSYLKSGAALSIYGIRKGAIQLIDETPSIGIPNRWLNPAVVADVDNDGKLEIAYVETPHIGGILHVLNLVNDKLVYKYKTRLTSNHAIGSRIQELAAAVDWNGDGITDIAVPNSNRSRVKVISFAQGKPLNIDEINPGSRILTAIVSADLNNDKKPELIFSLFSGQLVLLTP